MKRPLFGFSVCLVAAVAFFQWMKPETGHDAWPDGSHITVAGRICEKDAEAFGIRLLPDGRMRGKLQVEAPEESNHTSDNISKNFPTNIQQITADSGNLYYNNLQYNNLQYNNLQYNNLQYNNLQYNNLQYKNLQYRNLQYKKLQYKKLQCEWEDTSSLVLGSIVVLEGEFDAYTRATNPGEFDYAVYYHSLGYAGRVKAVHLLALEDKRPGIKEWLYRLRCLWEKRLYQIFPQKEASILSAILLGDKANLDAEVKTLYRRNGIIHILSISGLHITLLGMGLYKRLRKLGLPVWAAALAGSVLLFLYGMLTGFGVSACRAIGMYLLRMLAQILGRTYDMLTALGVMAAVMVCANPEWLKHMGFLLSFASILGVGVLLPALARAGAEDARLKLHRYVEGKWRKRLAMLLEKCLSGLRQSLLAGLSITLTTLPIQLWFSYEVPVYSLFLNIVILPFMSVVMTAGLIAMLVPGAGIVGTVDVLILAGYEGLCRIFEKLPHPMWNPGRPQVWAVVGYYGIWVMVACGSGFLQCASAWTVTRRESAGIRRMKLLSFGSALWEKHLRKRRLWRKLLPMCAAVLFLGLPDHHGNRVTFLDVGQGDGICMELASGEVYLFDCGSSSRKKIGERVLIPFLKYHGISRIDGVFLSHGDADHMNGLLELLEESEEEHLEIRQVILPELVPDLWEEEFEELVKLAEGMKKPAVITAVHAGMAWQSGKGAVFLCLHPAADGDSVGGNEGSECFYVSFSQKGAQATMLLTGDVEGSGEQELLEELKKYQITDIDLLKCPHHGSRGTTGEELLAQLSPRATVISCGRNNRYGHPHEELLERLGAVGSAVYRTDCSGAVTWEVRLGAARLETFVGEDFY